MLEQREVPTGVNLDLINIVLNAQSLCLQHAFQHIAKVEGSGAASAFKPELLEAVRDGSIDMALLEDKAIYDFVVTMIEKLPAESDGVN